jgi:hypothetical protein
VVRTLVPRIVIGITVALMVLWPTAFDETARDRAPAKVSEVETYWP